MLLHLCRCGGVAKSYQQVINSEVFFALISAFAGCGSPAYLCMSMNDIIHLLPDSVANQIAAGEVIQRPASVVKELVENAVDAGATQIQIVIRDAGRTLIQVIDNGKGMSDTDARMAFERHATSKITCADDLFTLHTMGFRGEALASICAVAQVDLRTMPRGAQMGTRIEINGSRIERQHPEICAQGTNIMVKNLFFNVPARRKFLKKDSVELNNIMREFERMALVNPGVDFTLVSNDVTVHKFMRSSFKQRIADLFGKSLDKQLIPIGTETSIVKIDGFISRPEFSRRRGQLQYYTVNGRHMRHPYFHKALMSCYEQLIPSDEQPNYFINLTVDPDTIDVNIHPTKNEIKFENEQPIWQILTAAIRESLGSFNAVPAIDFADDSTNMDIPVFDPDSASPPTEDVDSSYNPFAGQAHGYRPAASSFSKPSLSNWESLYEGFAAAKGEEERVMRSSSQQSCDMAGSLESLFDGDGSDDGGSPAVAEVGSLQLKGRFIVIPSKSGLMVVEQHRAHKRILFEKYMVMFSHGNFTGQKMMFPENLQLSAAQEAVLKAILPQLVAMGFELHNDSPGRWTLVSVPSLQKNINPADTLAHILDDATFTGEEPGVHLRNRLAQLMAEAEAIPVGQHLSAAEREHIIEELFRLPSPNFTPDGKLILSILPVSTIINMF